jgi:hypothetical protein
MDEMPVPPWTMRARSATVVEPLTRLRFTCLIIALALGTASVVAVPAQIQASGDGHGSVTASDPALLGQAVRSGARTARPDGRSSVSVLQLPPGLALDRTAAVSFLRLGWLLDLGLSPGLGHDLLFPRTCRGPPLAVLAH